MGTNTSVLLAAGGVIGVCGVAAVVAYERSKRAKQDESVNKLVVVEVLSGARPTPTQRTANGKPGAWKKETQSQDNPVRFSPAQEFAATITSEGDLSGPVMNKHGLREAPPTAKSIEARLRQLVPWVYLFVWDDPAKVLPSLPHTMREQKPLKDAAGEKPAIRWVFGLPREAGNAGPTRFTVHVPEWYSLTGFQWLETFQRKAPTYQADAV